MYRILALLLILSIALIGCAAEPTPTLEPTPEPPTAVPTEAPTNTPEPTATLVPTVAPTNTTAPTATPAPVTGVVKSTLNVREQPTTKAKLLGVLKKDDTVTLVGRTEDKSWLQINYPLGEKTTAWVIAERIDTAANLDALQPVVAAAPTAAATQVAVQPTAVVTATSAVSPTAQATTAAGATVAPTTVTTDTAQATPVAPTAAPTTEAQPPATGGTPPGSIIYEVFENGSFNIYRVRADGTGQQLLIEGGSEPALSPDGSRIAYHMRRDTGGLGVGLASATGQFQRKLSEESAAGYPTWSPDGNHIAFNVVPSNRLSSQIWRIGVGPDNTPVVVADGWRPAWQPAPGLNVLFDGCKAGAQCGSILTMKAFDGDPNNPNVVTTGTAGAWSPNASQIAFQAADDKGSTQIWIVNADGTGLKQVTTDTGTHGMPIWSSDGQWLFYRTDQAGKGWAIYAIRTNGSDARKIADANVHPDQWVYAKMAIAP